MARIVCRIVVDTDENDHRLDLLHRNLQKFGTVYNTVMGGTQLEGTIERGARTAQQAADLGTC